MSEEETGSRHMHMFTGQQAEKQHNAGTGLQIYVAAIFLQRHAQGGSYKS